MTSVIDRAAPTGRQAAGRLASPSAGRPEDPAWARPALVALLSFAAVLYVVGLDVSGWANAYYSAAVQAATRSWKAAFFGSFDPSGFITVDKPPAALWVMDLSARAFGLSSWSILLPQALEGVASVWVLYLTVRRGFGAAAGLLSGLLLAVTPVAALMFRFNNPDALLTLLTLAGGYAVIRAVEPGGRSGRWLTAAGALIGLGFLTKMAEALVVVPVLAAVYLRSGPGPVPARLARLCGAGVAMVVTAGWWVAAVMLVPTGGRPYIGSSQDNSLLSLIFGYNGFGRLTGAEPGAVGFTSTSSGGGGHAGLLRLANAQFRGQIGWLIPAAVLGGVAALWLTRRAPRSDPARASLLLWAGSFAVTGGAVSVARGMVHPYYSLSVAPAVCALTAIGACLLWPRRDDPRARAALTAGLCATLVWAAWIATGSAPWTASGAAAAAVVAGLSALFGRALGRHPARLSLAVASLGLLGPALVSGATAVTPHRNAIAVAGATAAPLPIGRHQLGDLLTAGQPSAALVSLLDSGSPSYRWVAATVGGEPAAGVQLATRRPVMAVGGFNGTDPVPTLEAFQGYVRSRAVHWFLVAPEPPGPAEPGGAEARAITSWVESRFPFETVRHVRAYDLSR